MNTNKKFAASLLAAALLASGSAHAGKIVGVKVEPPNIVAGGQARITVDGEDEGICGLRVEYGNGDVDVTRMAKDKDNFPRSFMHTFAGAGTFTITAKGGRDGSAFGCTGEAKTTITVAAPPPPPPPPRHNRPPVSNAPPPEPSCPTGYVLNKKSVNAKTSAYSCNATKGAQLPSSGMDCPSGTAYYTNTAGTLLGCKAVAKPK